MLKKILFGIGLLGLSIAMAKTYTISLSEPVTAGATQLSPGEYKLVINGSTAVLTDSKGKLQINGILQTESQKFDNTAVRSSTVDGAPHLEAIEVGGTHTEVDFK